MATRKDFEGTARILRSADLSPRQHRDLTRAFAGQFASNEKFDRVAFYVASGLQPHTDSHIYDGTQVFCDCGSEKFVSAGRSLDYHYEECLACGKTVSLLTETGASA